MRKSTQVALGGLSASLCLLLMFLTGVFPFATYALPAIAGAFLIAVVIENGRATAWMVYVAVSLLSVFIVPDKEAALMFVAFFGYYPIIKEKVENLPIRLIQWFVKFVIFNLAILSSYWLIIQVLGVSQIVAEFSDMGQFALMGLLAIANVTFWLYDITLTKFIIVYLRILRVRLLRRLK